VARAQRDALQVQGRLGHVAVGHARVALAVDLDLQAGKFGDLPVYLAQATLRVLADLVGDGNVATLDRNLHHRLPSVEDVALRSLRSGVDGAKSLLDVQPPRDHRRGGGRRRLPAPLAARARQSGRAPGGRRPRVAPVLLCGV